MYDGDVPIILALRSIWGGERPHGGDVDPLGVWRGTEQRPERLENFPDDDHSPERTLGEVSCCNSLELGVQRGPVLIRRRARVA